MSATMYDDIFDALGRSLDRMSYAERDGLTKALKTMTKKDFKEFFDNLGVFINFENDITRAKAYNMDASNAKLETYLMESMRNASILFDRLASAAPIFMEMGKEIPARISEIYASENEEHTKTDMLFSLAKRFSDDLQDVVVFARLENTSRQILTIAYLAEEQKKYTTTKGGLAIRERVAKRKLDSSTKGLCSRMKTLEIEGFKLQPSRGSASLQDINAHGKMLAAKERTCQARVARYQIRRSKRIAERAYRTAAVAQPTPPTSDDFGDQVSLGSLEY